MSAQETRRFRQAVIALLMVWIDVLISGYIEIAKSWEAQGLDDVVARAEVEECREIVMRLRLDREFLEEITDLKEDFLEEIDCMMERLPNMRLQSNFEETGIVSLSADAL